MAKGKAPRTPPLRKPGRPSQPMDPNKAVMAAQRLRPITTREYGKGGTPLSGGPKLGTRGAGIGYGGPEEPV